MVKVLRRAQKPPSAPKGCLPFSHHDILRTSPDVSIDMAPEVIMELSAIDVAHMPGGSRCANEAQLVKMAREETDLSQSRLQPHREAIVRGGGSCILDCVQEFFNAGDIGHYAHTNLSEVTVKR